MQGIEIVTAAARADRQVTVEADQRPELARPDTQLGRNFEIGLIAATAANPANERHP